MVKKGHCGSVGKGDESFLSHFCRIRRNGFGLRRRLTKKHRINENWLVEKEQKKKSSENQFRVEMGTKREGKELGNVREMDD